MSATLWGVIIGGLLTIAGQTVAELLKAHAQGKEREAQRSSAARDFHRDAVEKATEAAKDLQAVLVEQERTVAPSPDLELRLRQATSEFQRLVPRVKSDRVRVLLERWQDAAVAWANTVGTQAAETTAWKAAVDECGQEVRRHL